MGDGKVHLAKSLQVRGRVAEAEALYREVLATSPKLLWHSKVWASLSFNRGEPRRPRSFSAGGPPSARFPPASMPTWAKPCVRPTGPIKLSRTFVGRPSSTRRSRMRGIACAIGLLAESIRRVRGLMPGSHQALTESDRGLHQPGKCALRP